MTSPATAEGAAAGAGGQGTSTQGGGVQPGGGSSAGGQGGGTQGGQQGTGTGGQPAGGKGTDNGLYAEYLEGIPAQLHPTVTKAFQKWDANVTQRQQEVRSQYAPYQPLIDSGADPQQLQVAQQFVEWLQEDPAEALRQMVETFELDPQQLFGQGGQQQQAGPAGVQGGAPDEGQGAGPGGLQGADGPPPWFQQWQDQTVKPLEELVQLMAQERVAQHQTQQSEREIDELQTMLDTGLKGAGSSLEDEQAVSYVLGQLAIADDQVPLQQAVDQAVAQWQQLRQSIGGQAASAQVPPVLPGGGGLPTQQVDPATLSSKERRALVTQNALRSLGRAQ